MMSNFELVPEVGSLVRIRRSVLDARSKKRGDDKVEFKVVALLGNDWVRIQNPRGTSLWPIRMLCEV